MLLLKKIVHQDNKLVVGSLDVVSFLTSRPLIETINICINLQYNTVDVIKGIYKSELENVLSLDTQESFPELKWLERYSSKLKPAFYRIYVHDIFVLFRLNQLSISQNLMHILIQVILIWLFDLNRKKW